MSWGCLVCPGRRRAQSGCVDLLCECLPPSLRLLPATHDLFASLSSLTSFSIMSNKDYYGGGQQPYYPPAGTLCPARVLQIDTDSRCRHFLTPYRCRSPARPGWLLSSATSASIPGSSPRLWSAIWPTTVRPTLRSATLWRTVPGATTPPACLCVCLARLKAVLYQRFIHEPGIQSTGKGIRRRRIVRMFSRNVPVLLCRGFVHLPVCVRVCPDY